MLALREDEESRRKFVSIHVTDVCNERCSFCVVSSPMFARSEVLDADIWRFLADHQGGYNALNIHGGEPTLYPRLFELLEYAGSLGYVEIHIQTNGRRLEDPALVAALISRGVALFVVSLHGDRGTHEALNGIKGSWDQTITAINNIHDQGASVRTNIVLCQQNIAQLMGYAEMLVDLGVRHANFSNLHPVGSAYFSFQQHAVALEVIREHLAAPVRHLQHAGVRVTLEGMPLCVLPEHVDLNIELMERDVPLLWKGMVLGSYERFMDEHRRKGTECSRCAVTETCGGVYREYVDFMGFRGVVPFGANSRVDEVLGASRREAERVPLVSVESLTRHLAR